MSKIALAFTTMVVAVNADAGDQGEIMAGYTMATDCHKHANIAYDAKALKSCLTAGDDGKYTGGDYSDGTSYDTWEECALDLYTNGFNSCKSGDSAVNGGTGCESSDDSTGFRTLKKFSTDAASKFVKYQDFAPNEVAYMFYDYHGTWTWGDDWMQAATGATGVWAETLAWDGVTGSAEDARKQATKKGAGFIVNQMYAMYEYHRRAAQAYACMSGSGSSSSQTCTSKDFSYSMAHGWDEGWAFFAGALESGVADSGIDWPLTLAEKRDGSFATDDATYNPNGGKSRVNAKVLAASQIGRDHLTPFSNATDAGQIVWDAWKCIEQQAFLPMIQGCILYMYKSTPDVCGTDCGDAYGEMYTFCEAMVPILSNANPTAATTLMDYASPDMIGANGLTADFDTMSAVIYDNLNAMGYKISDVGACTYCGKSLADYDTSGDDAVSNKCGPIQPVDEASCSVTTVTTTTTTITNNNDDGGDDDDCEDAPMSMASIIVLIIGVLLAVGGGAMCMMGKNKVSP